jgi:hypothetical protein
MNKFIEVNGKLINKDYIVNVENYAGLYEADDKECTIGFYIYINYIKGNEIKMEAIKVMEIIFPNVMHKELMKDNEFLEIRNMCLKKLKEQFEIIKEVLGTDKIVVPTQEE